MKILLITCSILLFTFLENSSDSTLRESFHEKDHSEKLLLKLLETPSKTPIDNAYKSIITCMLAEHTIFPHKKLSFFNKGKNQLETLIKENPNQPDARYIRLLLQLNTPTFIGYNTKIEEDINKLVLLQNEVPLKWKSVFLKNLLKSKYINEKQKKILIERFHTSKRI